MSESDKVLGLSDKTSGKVKEVDDNLFKMLVEFNLANDFHDLLIKRAELLARQLPMCQTDRQASLIAGATMICYELADNISIAQAKLDADASAENLARIRRKYGLVDKNAPSESLG